jgi:Icc-related predicted phosphoesterase
VKILAISDIELPHMQNVAYLRRTYEDVDLVISCGDLSASYIEFITSVLNVPLLYVSGNHDTNYQQRPPGGDNLHMRVIRYRGLTFAGLEGSPIYNNGALQYSETQMYLNLFNLAPRLLTRRLFKSYGVDVFLTHAPPRHIHDREDRAHQGFKAFRSLISWFRPRYLLHGHVDVYDRRDTTWTEFKGTQVVNIDPVRILEIDKP